MGSTNVFDGKTIRTVMRNGDPWFVAKDIYAMLAISKQCTAAKRLGADEKSIGSVITPGGAQTMIIVSESGLYKLISASKKDEAELFKKWVVENLVPSIRKTNSCSNARPAKEEKKQSDEVFARQREEQERQRLEAEAALARQREEQERPRLEAEAALARQREEQERQRLEAEAALARQREKKSSANIAIQTFNGKSVRTTTEDGDPLFAAKRLDADEKDAEYVKESAAPRELKDDSDSITDIRQTIDMSSPESVSATAMEQSKATTDFNQQLRLVDGSTCTIKIRADGYVNATHLAMLSGKKFGSWYRSQAAKELIEELKRDVRFRTTDLLEVRKGGSQHFEQGSWIHPDLAIPFAQWCSPRFAIALARQREERARQSVAEAAVARQRETESNANLVIQTFNGKSIRIITKDGDPWFVAKDICAALEISNSCDALERLDADEKGLNKVDTPGGAQEMQIVNEPGLYNLIFTSRKAEAKLFKKWVMDDLMPSIRKTSSCSNARLAKEEKKQSDEALARQRDEQERQRIEAEAALARQREEQERQRLEAEAALARQREEQERQRVEAEASLARQREKHEQRVACRPDKTESPAATLQTGTLKLNNVDVMCRLSDGYINVTALCRAGGKAFRAWNENMRSEQFLHALSDAVGIPTASLIQFERGRGAHQCSWAHPQVAINIAQWLSPVFDVQVSRWVQELLINGKVELEKSKIAQLELTTQRLIEEKKQSDEALARQREKHEKQTQELTAKNARLQQLAIQIQNRRSASDPLNKTEVVYIDSTRAYAMQGIFKIGRTKDSKTRLVGLNTSHVAEDELEHVRIIKTHNARLLEAFLHMYFKSCHHDREWYRVPYEVLMAELDQIELHFENLRQANLAFMASTDTRYRTQLIDEIDWARGLDMNVFKITPAPPRAAVADGARLIVLDPQQAINAIPPADREAVLNLASAYVNTTYKNVNPPCEHTTARANGHQFPLHIPDFREWGSSVLKVPAINLVQWNEYLHGLLATHHKQIRSFLRRPTNWKDILKDHI